MHSTNYPNTSARKMNDEFLKDLSITMGLIQNTCIGMTHIHDLFVSLLRLAGLSVIFIPLFSSVSSFETIPTRPLSQN